MKNLKLKYQKYLNDLEGLLLTSPFETNGGNNQNDFIEKESKKDLIDKDNV